MLVSFTIENWKSFRNETSFSLAASREQQHRERVPKVQKYRAGILPTAVIYGANASGKTNLFHALGFAQDFIIRGTQPDEPIRTEPFLLDDRIAGQPSRFVFELLIDETIYEFSFVVTRQSVREEKLVRVNTTGEKTLYHRRNRRMKLGQRAGKKRTFLEFVHQGTRENQLFLTSTVFQNMEEFRPVYDWFRNQLVLITPASMFGDTASLLDDAHPLHEATNQALQELDTGIVKLGMREVPMEEVFLPEPDKKHLLATVARQGKARGVLIPDLFGRQIVATLNSKGNPVFATPETLHRKAGGDFARFSLKQESSGTQRLFELLPALIGLSHPDARAVYVIDEVERSLHTLLTRRLIEKYLAGCSESARKQLLLTTHDVQLMDQKLFRRDEMWVTERDSSGVSKLIPFSDYRDIRHDKNILKSYLQGRMGGIPVFQSGGAGDLLAT